MMSDLFREVAAAGWWLFLALIMWAGVLAAFSAAIAALVTAFAPAPPPPLPRQRVQPDRWNPEPETEQPTEEE
jgi:hypothetical protein